MVSFRVKMSEIEPEIDYFTSMLKRKGLKPSYDINPFDTPSIVVGFPWRDKRFSISIENFIVRDNMLTGILKVYSVKQQPLKKVYWSDEELEADLPKVNVISSRRIQIQIKDLVNTLFQAYNQLRQIDPSLPQI